MSGFESELAKRLEELRSAGLYRQLRKVDSPQSPKIRLNGREVLNFSSNDYLGLADEPELKHAAIEAIKAYGAGAGASRLICGSLRPFNELDECIAQFKGTEAALSFSTGYAAALGTICALVDKQDVVVIDKLVHASIVDAARLSGATLRVFKHNDLNDLEDILKWTRARTIAPLSQVLIVTESVFSMDGDHASVRELVELKDRFGAWLMVDEAHSTGLYGPRRRGLAEEMGVGARIEIQMGTLGKALGAAGGYICGSRTLIDYLINRARSFIFSTAPVPAAAAAAAAGIRFVQSNAGQERCQQLWERVSRVQAGLRSSLSSPSRTAIIPIMIGDEQAAVSASAGLLEQGILVPAIRYPTVARGRARLRVTVSAAHSQEDVDGLVQGWGKLGAGAAERLAQA